MAVNAFISFFDKAEGESTQKGMEKWVEIQGWDWDVEAESSWTKGGGQRASSAFIIVARPGDRKPYLDLNIFGQGKGGQNAVDLLRKKFERWKAR